MSFSHAALGLAGKWDLCSYPQAGSLRRRQLWDTGGSRSVWLFPSLEEEAGLGASEGRDIAETQDCGGEERRKAKAKDRRALVLCDGDPVPGKAAMRYCT